MKNYKMEFNMQVSIFMEGNKYVAYSPALDLSTSGDSYSQVKKRFNECVNIFFEEIIEKGTVANVLRDLGWKKIKSRWNPPVLISQEIKNIKVPA